LSNLEVAVRELDAAAALVRESDGWRPSRADRAKARRSAALALITAGDLAQANRRLEAAMEDLAGEEHSSEYPNVLYHVAQLRWHEGRHSDAYGVAERCLQVAERQGDPKIIAKGYEILSLSCHSLGEWKKGIEFEERRRALVGSTVDVAQAFDVHL
jgi:tetratricopeptide (TPR) repeat protein